MGEGSGCPLAGKPATDICAAVPPCTRAPRGRGYLPRNCCRPCTQRALVLFFNLPSGMHPLPSLPCRTRWRRRTSCPS